MYEQSTELQSICAEHAIDNVKREEAFKVKRFYPEMFVQ
jgi:hypothetical protein